MQGNRRCSGAWWAISIEDGVRVNWHANVCAPAFIVPQPICTAATSAPSGDHGGEAGPGLAGGYGPGDTQPWLLPQGQDQEVAWATTTVATRT